MRLQPQVRDAAGRRVGFMKWIKPRFSIRTIINPAFAGLRRFHDLPMTRR